MKRMMNHDEGGDDHDDDDDDDGGDVDDDDHWQQLWVSTSTFPGISSCPPECSRQPETCHTSRPYWTASLDVHTRTILATLTDHTSRPH